MFLGPNATQKTKYAHMYEMWDAAAEEKYPIFKAKEKKNPTEVYPFIYMSHINYT